MANNYGDEQVMCPFFHEQRNTEILCNDDDEKDDISGVMLRGRFLRFCNGGQKDNWMTDYCTGFLFRTCPTYLELEKEWERKHGGEKR